MHRHGAIGVLFAGALVTSGCIQAVTGDTITFEASPASVDGQTLDANGYALDERDSVQVDRTVQVPVVGERDVRITNHVRVYGPATNESGKKNATPAVMFLVSTPQAKVAGQGTNPLGRVPLEELVTRVASRGQGFDDMEPVGTHEVTTLGKTTTVEKYSTTAQLEGESVETFVYVTRVPHGDDYVISVAMLPKQFAGEEGTIYELMGSIDHDDGE
jgi:hypothetical protein